MIESSCRNGAGDAWEFEMNFWLYETATLIAMGNDTARVIDGVSRDAGPAAREAYDEISVVLQSRGVDVSAQVMCPKNL